MDLSKIIEKGPALPPVPPPDSYFRIKQNIDNLFGSLGNVLPLLGPQALTAAQLKQIQSALQASGGNPLNLTALPGVPSVLNPPTPDVILDSSTNLGSYPAANYPLGTFYYETDLAVTLMNQVVGGVNYWAPYHSQSLTGTHAQRLLKGSVWYPRGTGFLEDEGPTYLSKDATGVVSTSGNVVTFGSGIPFNVTFWPGYPVVIDGATYFWDTVSSPTSGTVKGAGPGTLIGVAYSVPSGVWQYECGSATGTYPLPSGLGLADANYEYNETSHGHKFYRNTAGTGWEWRDDGGAGQISFGIVDPTPVRFFVKITPGGSADIAQEDGTVLTVNFPAAFDNGVDGLAWLRMGSSYNGTPTAATMPTWVGGVQQTETESADQFVAAGADIAVAAANHYHNVDNTVTKIEAPNDTNGGLFSSMTFPMYIRI